MRLQAWMRNKSSIWHAAILETLSSIWTHLRLLPLIAWERGRGARLSIPRWFEHVTSDHLWQRRMVPSETPGNSHHPPQLGWESLCDDVKQFVLSKLTLRDLASTADTCRDFRKAFQSKLERERAGLIAVAEESFGANLFQALVPALRRSMSGHCPCPSLPCVPCLCPRGKVISLEDCEDFDEPHILFSNAGEPQYLTWQDNALWSRCRDGGCAVITEQYADLFPRVSEGRIHTGLPPRAFMDLRTDGRGDEKYKVQVDDEAFGATVGLLMAIFTQNPKAQLASFRSPLTLEFKIWGWEGHAIAGARPEDRMPHWEGKLDPLRPFAKSITVYPWG